VLKKTNFQKRASFRRINSSKEKIKGSRLGIAVLFLGTVLLSAFFWLKNQKGDWFKRWQEKLSQPFIYKISGRSDKDLSKSFGVKLDLKDVEGLKKTINLLTKDLAGDYSLYFYNIKQKTSFNIKQDQVFKAASINKIPIIVSFYQEVEKGRLDEEAEYVLQEQDIQNYGAGSMRYQEPGTKHQYVKLIELVGKNSDNTAAYVIANLVGEKEIQKSLDKLGLEQTSIKENTTTPQEMGDYLVKLYENELVEEKYKEKIFNALTGTDFEDRIPAGVPDHIQVAHKTGNEVQVYNDCGLILSVDPYVLCILTKGVEEEEALEIIPKISRAIWEYNKNIKN